VLTFIQYINQFLESSSLRQELGRYLNESRSYWQIIEHENLNICLDKFIEAYNLLGRKDTKDEFGINQNLARNLPGAMMQDWLICFCKSVINNYPKVLIFTEVRVPFGNYPLWKSGNVSFSSPSERSDIAVGYLLRNRNIVDEVASRFQLPINNLTNNESVLPVITINSKIRVSQGEFFDWLGRETLMTKGNPHCFSIQVCLRKEMDLTIVEAAQAEDKWFLLGSGTENNVVPNYEEVHRLYGAINYHLEKRLGRSPLNDS
jgi:hypothetical protein